MMPLSINSEYTQPPVTMLGSVDGDSSRQLLDRTAIALKGMVGNALKLLHMDRVVVGVFFTGVKLNNGCGGVAYTPPELINRASLQILKGSYPAIKGMPVQDVIDGKVAGPFAEVVRLATLNALSVPLLSKRLYDVVEGHDLSGAEELFTGRRVCMVGAIIPLLRKLRNLGATETMVIDRKEDTSLDPGLGQRVAPDKMEAALSRCQTAVFTGAAIANGSITDLIAMVPKNAAIAVVGPTAGFIPDELFRLKVAMVGTVIVRDSDLALDLLSEGCGGYQLFNSCMQKINILNAERLRALNISRI